MFALVPIARPIMYSVGGALSLSLTLLSIPSVRGTWMMVGHLIAPTTTLSSHLFHLSCNLGNPPGHAFCGNWYVRVATPKLFLT